MIEDKTFLDKSKVTHIIIKDLKRLKHDHSYLPSKVVKFLGFEINSYDEGFYSDGNYNSFWGHIKMEYVKADKGLIVKDGKIYCLPNVTIYVGETLIYVRYFNDISECEVYVKGNYPNVNYKIK